MQISCVMCIVCIVCHSRAVLEVFAAHAVTVFIRSHVDTIRDNDTAQDKSDGSLLVDL